MGKSLTKPVHSIQKYEPAADRCGSSSLAAPARSGKIRIMTSKQIAIQTLQQLPDDATWDEIQERIRFVAGVRSGLRELDEGKGIPHERVREEFAEWLTD